MSEKTATSNKNWFARHKILTVVLALIVFAIIGSAGSKSGTNTSSTNGTQKAADQKAAEKTEYAVGEAATIGDQSLTVTKVTRDFNTGNQFSQPESNKEFVVLEIKIENNGTKQIDFNTYDFQVQDSNGVLKNEDFVVGVENKLNSGNLAAGGKVTGNLAFQVPKADAGLKLIFKPSFWSNKTVTVKL